jgi:hypothetical protein
MVEVEDVDVRLRRVEHDQAETQPDPCPRHPQRLAHRQRHSSINASLLYRRTTRNLLTCTHSEMNIRASRFSNNYVVDRMGEY